MKGRRFLLILSFVTVLLTFTTGLFSLDENPPGFTLFEETPARGDRAAAERYALWVNNVIDQGLWKEALAALERASDFADVSSDISYLLALARSHEGKPRGSVAGALNMALAVDRWNICDPEAARLFLAENLIAIRAYSEALDELSRVSGSPKEAELSLKILAATRPDLFRRYMEETLDRYPRECGPVRAFFSFLKTQDAAGRNPEKDDIRLLELIIRRLPVLLPKDADFAWMAAPYMRDNAEAKRLIMAYRAVNTPVRASLPASLRLGVINEETAIDELFDSSGNILDIALLEEVWELLRREEARTILRRNLSSYTGVIIEDADRDGIPETRAEYRNGVLVFSAYDTVQDGTPELSIYYEAGTPQAAKTLVPPSPRKEAALRWERYPALLEAELDGVRYIPRPLAFFYSPVRFVELWGGSVLFPRLDSMNPPLTRRAIVTQSLKVERPSLEFSGGTEVVELNQGIPIRAREYAGGLMVSETDFLRGRPQLQRVDLNLDGQMDTFRFFNKVYRAVEIEELWDYDRNIEYTVSNEE